MIPTRLTKADWNIMAEIMASRGYVFDRSRFPESGLTTGSCFGFLYLTDCTVGYLDSFICEKGMPEGRKIYEFSKIIRGLRLLAKFKGCRMVWAHSCHKNLLTASRIGGLQVIENNSSLVMQEIR
jgi:hypothetical protein